MGRKNYSSLKNAKLIKPLGTNKFVECLLGWNKLFVPKKYKSNKTFRDEIEPNRTEPNLLILRGFLLFFKKGTEPSEPEPKLKPKPKPLVLNQKLKPLVPNRKSKLLVPNQESKPGSCLIPSMINDWPFDLTIYDFNEIV